MAMTITEADAVTKLIHFVVSGELYTGQSEPVRSAATSLEYLGQRAAKVLAVTPAGDLATYAERLAPLAVGSDAIKADALREAANNLYLTDEGQHNEGAKDWLHRRANLIDPRTRVSVCVHGNPRSGDCGFCAGEASRWPS